MENIGHGAPFMDFGMCKNDWSGPEYDHLDSERYRRLKYSVDIKPEGTWDSIKGAIVQGDSLSPLLFVVIMIPLSLILRNTIAGYRLKKEGCKINHLLFMGWLESYMERVVAESLVQRVWSYSEDIGIKFGIEKCAVLELERGRLVKSEGIQ